MRAGPPPSRSPARCRATHPRGQADGMLKFIFFGLGRHIFKSLQSHLLISVSSALPGQSKSFLVWKIPRQQPCPTPENEQNQHPKAQGCCSAEMPKSRATCPPPWELGLTLPLQLTPTEPSVPPKDGHPQSQAQLWDQPGWLWDAHPPSPKPPQGWGDSSEFPGVSATPKAPLCFPAQCQRGWDTVEANLQ